MSISEGDDLGASGDGLISAQSTGDSKELDERDDTADTSPTAPRRAADKRFQFPSYTDIETRISNQNDVLMRLQRQKVINQSHNAKVLFLFIYLPETYLFSIFADIYELLFSLSSKLRHSSVSLYSLLNLMKR